MDMHDCPQAETLHAYMAGRLDDDSLESVAGHVETCPNCQTVLGTLDDASDTLIAHLRGGPATDPYQGEAECGRAIAAALAMVEPSSDPPQAARTREPQPVPRQLGDYEILAKLGEGGMGAVYKARHVRLDKIVALKILPQGRIANPQAINRFEREMKAVGRLSHPNIVEAHDARDIDGTTVLVMEHVAGLDLAEVVRRLGPLPVAAACEIVRQTAVGLHYVYENGLVHRDIKPSNLMLTILPSPSGRGAGGEGLVKILDLGLALLGGDRPAGGEVTLAGSAIGTVDYIAPEQIIDAHSVDIRADIYSLGGTLYRLLTGAAPFSGRKHQIYAEKVMGHLKETPPPVRELRPEVPADLAAVVERMMAKSKAGRYAVPGEAAAAVAPFAAGADLARLLAAAQAAPADAAAAGEKQGASTGPLASSAAVPTDSSSISVEIAEGLSGKAETGPPLPPGEGRGEGRLGRSDRFSSPLTANDPHPLPLSRRERGAFRTAALAESRAPPPSRLCPGSRLASADHSGYRLPWPPLPCLPLPCSEFTLRGGPARARS